MVGLRGKTARGQSNAIASQAAHTERNDIQTALPAQIVDFDAATQTATVKVMHVPKLNGKDFPIPELKKVPVVFPRGGGAALTWPVNAKDPGRIVMAGRNMDDWYDTGEAKSAQSNRMQSLSDAHFEPGALVDKKNKIEKFNTKKTELRHLKEDVSVAFDGEVIVMHSDEFRAICRKGKCAQIKFQKSGIVHVSVTATEIIMSHAPTIGPDPNPGDD
jgi:hypothetical protein